MSFGQMLKKCLQFQKCCYQWPIAAIFDYNQATDKLAPTTNFGTGQAQKSWFLSYLTAENQRGINSSKRKIIAHQIFNIEITPLPVEIIKVTTCGVNIL